MFLKIVCAFCRLTDHLIGKDWTYSFNKTKEILTITPTMIHETQPLDTSLKSILLTFFTNLNLPMLLLKFTKKLRISCYFITF